MAKRGGCVAGGEAAAGDDVALEIRRRGSEVREIDIPLIEVTSLNDRENLIAGSDWEITWESVNVDFVFIEYSTDGGNNWESIEGPIANTGSYNWKIPYDISSDCLVRVSDVHSKASGESKDVFTISP